LLFPSRFVHVSLDHWHVRTATKSQQWQWIWKTWCSEAMLIWGGWRLSRCNCENLTDGTIPARARWERGCIYPRTKETRQLKWNSLPRICERSNYTRVDLSTTVNHRIQSGNIAALKRCTVRQTLETPRLLLADLGWTLWEAKSGAIILMLYPADTEHVRLEQYLEFLNVKLGFWIMIQLIQS